MSLSSAVLRLSIDQNSGISRYQQLLDQFKTLCYEKHLVEGDKLPSSRELAGMLGVSRATAVKVYDILISEGYLVSQPKKGVYVAHLLPLLMEEQSRNRAAKSPPHTVGKLESTLQVKRVQLNSGVDVSAFPNKAWAASMRRSWLKPDLGVMQGEYLDGLPKLKQHLAEYLASVRGLICEPEQIIITSGNRDALSILSHALLSKPNLDRQSGSQVWLENPCFSAMSRFFHWLGSDLKPLIIDQEGAQTDSMMAQAASNKVQLAVMTPNRQYPLGMAMSSFRRQQWLSLLMQANQDDHKRLASNSTGLWVIEDDYDNEFYYQGHLGIPLMGLDESQRTFLIGSFSKVMFRGLRLGYIVMPKAQIQRVKQSQRELGPSASLPMQSALFDFIKSGAFSAHLRRMRRHYRQKRDFLDSQINSHLALYCDWQKPNGGMHTVLYINNKWIQKWCLLKEKNTEYLDQHLVEMLAKQAIKVSSLSRHYFDDHELKQGFVLGFSEPSEAEMVLVISAIKTLFEQIFAIKKEC